jgi:hypothetical protein
MNQIQIQLARIDLSISINRLLFRSKSLHLSEEKKQNILSEAKALESVLETIKTLSKAIEQQYSINSNLHLENLRLKKQLLKDETNEEL